MVNEIKNCSCGREHVCTTENVVIGTNIVKTISGYVKEYSKILLIADDNTYAIVGGQIKDELKEKVVDTVILSNGKGVVIPDERSIKIIEDSLFDNDLIFGVGSGVINDLCKHVSFKHGLPYMIFGTAPSMDGYVSVGSALILGGMKITLNARPPKAVFADVDVLKDAPLKMIQAGYGDIIGKFSCLNDWKLSALINGEYFCKKIYDMTYNTAVEVKGLAEKIRERDADAIGKLMKALVDVGLAMSYVGNSRPASGSEHHLSHFFEITGILDGTPYYPHGIDVGYSSVETAKIREHVLKEMPLQRTFDEKSWEENIRRIYKTSADGIIALQKKLGWYHNDDSKTVYAQWDKIKDILSEAPTAEEVIKMLEAVGLDYSEFKDFYKKEKIADALLYAKDLKDRYTVLWLYFRYFA